MMFCAKCGAKNEDNSLFCGECGADSGANGNRDSLSAEESGPDAGAAPAAWEKRKRKGLVVGISLLAVVAVVAAALVFIGTGRSVGTDGDIPEDTLVDAVDDIRGNTTGNIANSGSVTQQGDWIYYFNYAYDEEWTRVPGLYKMRTDGTGKARLNDDGGSDINVAGDWIYYKSHNYSNYSDDNKLYKMRTDGTEKKQLSGDSVSSLNVVSDWIYYLSGLSIFKMRTDGTERTKLNDDGSSSINVAGGWIYYRNGSDDGKLYKIRTDGKGKTKLNNDESAGINVVGDWIYYCSGYRLYKIRTDGTEKTKLNSDDSMSINVAGDWIYYSKGKSSESPIYKMRTDGTEETRLGNALGASINVAGGWIFYENKNGFYKVRTDGTELQAVNEEPVKTRGTALVNSNEWKYKNEQGFSYTIQINIWEPLSGENAVGTAHPADSSRKLGAAASFDPVTDIAVPVSAIVINTTEHEQFETVLGVSFILNTAGREYTGSGIAPTRDDGRITVELFYSDGPTVKQFSSTNLWGYAQTGGWGVTWSDATKTGAVRRTNFFVIVHNYYSPATPEGDLALLDWITLRPMRSSADPFSGFYDADETYIFGASKVGITLYGSVY